MFDFHFLFLVLFFAISGVFSYLGMLPSLIYANFTAFDFIALFGHHLGRKSPLISG